MVDLIPESYSAYLDFQELFARTAPLHVDLGCGDGAFLLALAERHPDKNFLGIERLARRVAKARRRTAGLGNVRVLRAEISCALPRLFTQQSVEAFYLLFPDPWPKRRHQRRRIVTAEFLNVIHSALEENGLLRIATDQLDYFEQISRLAGAHTCFTRVDDAAGTGLVTDPLNGRSGNILPATKFERQFRQQGAPIYRLTLRKISPVI